MLRVRVETTPADVSPSGTAVVLTPASPATVDLFIKQGSSPETLVDAASVNDRGVIRRLDLSPQAVSADINQDAQTDASDYVLLHAGLAGPEVAKTQACDPRDINRDGYIDLKDVALLQTAFEGSGG